MLPLLILLILALSLPVRISSHSQVSHVVISEVQISGAAANDEFVELHNPTDCPVDLTDYKLWRKTATGATQGNLASSLSGTIPAHGYFLIAPTEYTGTVVPDSPYTTLSRLASNNTVILYADQAKTIIADKIGMGTAGDFEGIAAPNPDSGKSITRTGGQDSDNNGADFSVRETPYPQNSGSPLISSPGACTQPPPPPPPSSPPGTPPPPGGVAGESIVSIAEVRKMELAGEATTSGSVTVKPGTLSANYFYIQDNTGGLQIYSSSKSFPQLTVGQKVNVHGTISEAYNERRLKIASAGDIGVVGTGPVNPAGKKTGEIGEAFEGQLVRVRGSVTQTSGDTFFLDDGSGEVKIYIRSETGIDKPRMSKGDIVSVVGIVSQYSTAYRILPREQADLAVGSDESADDGEVGGTETDGSAADGESQSENGVVFAARNDQTESGTLPARMLFPTRLRLLGWGSIALGAVLLFLIPLMIWEKRTGWLHAHLTKREDSSKK